jgi:hypothetical protein
MAYSGHRVEVFIPAGRKRTMSILLDNLYRFKDTIDRVQVWQNTDEQQTEDREWLYTLENKYPGWVKLVERRSDRGIKQPKQLNTGGFYINTIDESTIYFRFDDDIVYIDDDYFKNMIGFRLANPDYFIVFGNIINNAITSYYLQQEGKIPEDYGIVEEDFCMDAVGWTSPFFAYNLHKKFLKHVEADQVSEMYLSRPYELDRKRFSVSNFCFFGKDFNQFGGELNDSEEEKWLTEDYPKEHNVMNVICPDALVVHYSFFAQREYLNKKNVLEEYKSLAKQKLSDSYYSLLNESNKREASDSNITR